MKSCPKCEIALTPKAIGSLEVEECKLCRGVWFDKDKLRQAKDIIDSDLNWMDFEIWTNEEKFKTTGSGIVCPVCDIKTQSIDYDSTGVKVDCCSSCHGIWLDENKFSKIIDSLEQELVSKSFSEYVTASIEEAKEIITGPESFMSEWKDFSTVLRLMEYRLFVERPKWMTALLSIQRANPLK